MKSATLRALAITCAESSPLILDCSGRSAGLPEYPSVSIMGLCALAKAPDEIRKRLNQEVVRFLKTPETNCGVASVGSSPKEFGAANKTELDRRDCVIKDSCVKPYQLGLGSGVAKIWIADSAKHAEFHDDLGVSLE